MRKYQLRYLWYCSIATAVIIFVVLGIFIGDYVYTVFSDWRFLLFCLVPIISVAIASFISFRLLYLRSFLAKCWLVGILNFMLSHVFVFLSYAFVFYLNNNELVLGKAFAYTGIIIVFGGILTLPAFIILAYRAYPVNNK